MGLEGIVSKRLDAPYRSGPSKTWLKSKNPLSEARAARARRKSGINLCAVLTRTHVFDGPKTILQRSNGDHEIVAARVQINRIVRARKVSRTACVQNVNGVNKVVDQHPDLGRLSRHNATLGTEVNLMFHFPFPPSA
jgi:hypothetical protein